MGAADHRSPPLPPYQAIATELRRRIADGELRPGARVPSTRQVARQWGVALATATRALSTLQQEGLIQARPRVGAVVAARGARTAASGGAPGPRVTPPGGRSRAAPDADGDLTRARVVRAAIEIADTEGLAALSMRSVAARLGVATMSPYRYVSSKDQLVALMADAAFGEERCADTPSDNWRERLEIGARTLWRMFRRHPWLAQISSLSRPLPLPNLSMHADWILAALQGLGLDTTTAFNLHVVLYNYVHGMAVNLEREAQAEAASGLSAEGWMHNHAAEFDAIAASGQSPTFARVLAHLSQTGYDLDLDALFEFGLSALLEGFGALIERHRWSDAPSSAKA